MDRSKHIKVLSLFDGMSCGNIAFEKLNIPIESYDAYEIDKYAIQAAQENFFDLKEHGDVFSANFTQYNGCDFLIGGSPCTYWSIAQQPGKREKTASGLGWELFSQYFRALKEAKPKFFIYENNQSMSKAIRESITESFGFEPNEINSALLTAQNRKRLYWVGKRTDKGYVAVNIEPIFDRQIWIRDILDNYVKEAYAFSMTGDFTNRRASINKKAYCLAANPSSDMKARVIYPNKEGNVKIENGKIHIRNKDYAIDLEDGSYELRDLSLSECMKLQSVPNWYSFKGLSNTQAKKLLGNGWTIDVICHLIDSCYRS